MCVCLCVCVCVCVRVCVPERVSQCDWYVTACVAVRGCVCVGVSVITVGGLPADTGMPCCGHAAGLGRERLAVRSLTEGRPSNAVCQELAAT